MKNRDKLMQQSMYDFLCFMNANLRTNLRYAPCSTCIMDALHTDYSEYDRLTRCMKHDADCEKCLQSFMNEDPY